MKKFLLLALSIWFSVSTLMAQGAPASAGSTHSGDAAVPVALGQSVVALYGPWKFHVGDNPQWADPGFDDSHWETVDLRPTPETTLPAVPIPGFVSGWTSRGHAGYAGYAWYRIRVHISGADGPLTLLAPQYFDSAFQLFVNGHLAGSFGKFNESTPELYYDNPAMFSLPSSEYRPGPDGTTLLAFRFYMPPGDLRRLGTGGMHEVPRIGLPAAAGAIYAVEWEQEYRRLSSALAAALMYFFFALLTGMMFAFNRREKILLWPMSACLLSVIYAVLIFSTNAKWLSFVHLQALIDFAVTTAWYLWMLTWWAYFGLQHKRWLQKIIIVLGIVELIQAEFFVFALHVGMASHRLVVAAEIRDFIFGATSFLITAAIAWLGWNSSARGKWPLYLALLFFALPDLVPLLEFLHIRVNWQPFGIQLPLSLLCIVAMLFFFSIVLFQQFRASLQRQQATEEDVRQAQEVQSLLIPHQAPEIPGWRIESEYRPARQVGGDFFQVLPGSDGSLLIVVGDVSGKGLQAAMTVSAIVGALRDSHERRPEQVLAHLNRVLYGQISGLVTCSATLVAEDGVMTVASAGHLPPYRNGEELAVPSGLPLGILADASYEEQRYELAPSDRLTFISDGVVEARNSHGELLGFERMDGLSGKPAADIAETAQRWGQQDDITVLTVARAPRPAAVSSGPPVVAV
jgi:hypothetical protein